MVIISHLFSSKAVQFEHHNSEYWNDRQQASPHVQLLPFIELEVQSATPLPSTRIIDAMRADTARRPLLRPGWS